MQRFLMLSLVPAVLASSDSSAPADPQALVNSLFDTFFPELDVNGDGRLSAAEMTTFMRNLDISDEELVTMCQRPEGDTCQGFGSSSPLNDGDCDDGGPGSEYSICGVCTDATDCGARAICSGCQPATIVSTYDANGDGGLDRAEIIAALINNRDFTQLGPRIQSRISGAPEGLSGGGGGMDSMVSEITTVPATTLAATATVNVELAVTGSRIWPGQRASMKQYFATLWSLDIQQVIMNFIDCSTQSASAASEFSACSGSRRLAEGRALSSSTTWLVTAQGFVPNQAAADAAASATNIALENAATASTALGVTVASSPVVVAAGIVGMKPMPVGSFALIVIAFLGPLVGIMIACMYAGKAAKSAGENAGSCGGCCGYFAVLPWSVWIMVSVVILLIGCFLLFGTMQTMASSISAIIDQLSSASTMGGPIGSQLAGQIDASMLTQANQGIQLLPVASIVPGILVSIDLIVVSLCGCMKKSGGYCCAKFFIVLGYIFLIVATGLYMACVVIAGVMYVPQTQAVLRQYLAMCDTGVPQLGQIVADAQSAFALATAAGQASAVSEAQDMVTQGESAYNLLNTVCDNVTGADGLLTSIENMLTPAILCFSGCLFSLYNTFSICCAMGCCKNPHTGAKVGVSKGSDA